MTSIQANPSDQADDHGHDDHGHGHDPHLAHHFDSMEQQFDSGKLGMWLFLATEVLFFGGLFTARGFLGPGFGFPAVVAAAATRSGEQAEREQQRQKAYQSASHTLVFLLSEVHSHSALSPQGDPGTLDQTIVQP